MIVTVAINIFLAVTWFAVGFFFCKGRHHQYMVRGWTHLRDRSIRHDITQQDIFDAFPHGSWWSL